MGGNTIDMYTLLIIASLVNFQENEASSDISASYIELATIFLPKQILRKMLRTCRDSMKILINSLIHFTPCHW